jgi:hypothetical protein
MPSDPSTSCPKSLVKEAKQSKEIKLMKNRNTMFTTMNKLTLALLFAAALNTPPAEAVLIPSSLQAGVSYTFRVGDAAGGIAGMLQAVVRGRLELEETLTVPSGSGVDLVFTIPSRASRVILVLDPVLPGGQVIVTVLDQNGGTVIPPITFNDFTDHPHIEVVYEVAP